MHWFVFALLAPFLYAITNHIDKVLLERYFKTRGVHALLLISTLLSGIAIPVFFIQAPEALHLPISTIGFMCLVGCMNFIVLGLYLLALRDDEASVVIVFYQLVPVFGLILGYFLLGEVLSNLELIAMAIVIFGTSIVSFEIDSDNHFKVKLKTIFLMITASFFWALGSVVLKMISLQEGVPASLFWEHLTLLTIGVLLVIVSKKFRQSFVSIFKMNTKQVLILNFGNEVLYMIGNWVFAFSYLLAPIALILVMNSFQPIFVFMIGIILTIIAPTLGTEKISLFNISQKLIAIGITGVGTYLLLYS